MPEENIILNPDGDNQHIPQLSSGLFNNWRNLWEKNGALKSKRRNPLILFHGDKDPNKTHQDPVFPTDPSKTLPGNVGDTVVRPDASEKTSGGSVDSHNPFTTASDKVFLRLRVLDDEFKQLRDAKWVLHIDGKKYPEDPVVEGAFEDGGLINLEVPKTARIGKLIVRIPPPPSSGSSSPAPSSSPPTTSGPQPSPPPPIEIEFWLNIGRLDPIKDLAPAPDGKFTPGVQQRLNNLAFGAGTVNGIATPATESAIRRFQKHFGVTEEKDSTGKYIAGPLTQAELERLHDQPNKPAPKSGTTQATQPQTQTTTSPPSGGTQASTGGQGSTSPVTDDPLTRAKKKVETATEKLKAVRAQTSQAYSKWQKTGSEEEFDKYNKSKSAESQAKRELDQATAELKRLEGKT